MTILSNLSFITIAGLNLAVFRGSDGRAHIVDAHCSNLKVNLALSGTVSGDYIQCVKDDWKFHGDTGKCSSVSKSDSGQLRGNTSKLAVHVHH